MPGVFGATVRQSGDTADASITAFNTAVGSNAQGMKAYCGPSDGTGDSTGNAPNFPTTLGNDMQAAIDSGFTSIIVCYRPYINQATITSTWDSTAGSTGTSTTATHGGTKADWSALNASVTALNSLFAAGGVTMYVVLWQEIEHMAAPPNQGGMNLTAPQYWSMLSWYAGAVTTANGSLPGVPFSRLFHSSSASYSGNLDKFFPAGQASASPAGPGAALVGGATTDLYSRSWVNSYRLDSAPAGVAYTTPITQLCANAGIPFQGVIEFGVGGSGKLPTNTQVLNFLDYMNTVATVYHEAHWYWYGEYQDSPYGLIPGYASGATIPNPDAPPANITGPDCTPKLRTLAAILAGLPLSVTTTSLPGATAGASYSVTLGATGGTGSYTWALASGSLPHGLTLNTGAGTISGTPTAAGSSTFTASVTDTGGSTATSGSLTITVAAPVLTVTTTSLPVGTAGLPYGAALSAANGVKPYTWALASGGLPAGLALDPAGLIYGIPPASGASVLTVRVTDSATPTPATATSGSLAITVYAALVTITTTSLPAGTAGIAYSATLAAAGGTGVYTWSAAGLPPGFTLSASAGALACSDPGPGTSLVVFTVTDSAGAEAAAPLVIEIAVTAPGRAELAVLSGGAWQPLAAETDVSGSWVPGSLYSAS